MSIDINKFVNNYEFDFTLPGTNEVIMFKPITTGQLKKMVIYENEKSEEVIESVLDNIISECVISEGFDINNLYLEDRFALLLEIRKKSKGESYNFTYKCPKCKKITPVSIDLNTLKTNSLKPQKTPFIINDKMSVTRKFVTRKEQMLINKKLKHIKNKKLLSIEKTTYLYAMYMDMFTTPDGETSDVSLKDKVNILDNVFNDKQLKEYIEWCDSNTFGVDFRTEFKCEKCNHKEKVLIPLDNFFV